MKTNKKLQTNKFEHESKGGCYAFIRPSVRQFKRHSCISNERKSFLALHKQYRLTLFWKRAGGGGSEVARERFHTPNKVKQMFKKQIK